MTKKKIKSRKVNKRHEARRCGVQILYQWQLTESMSKNVFAEYVNDNVLQSVDTDYLQVLFLGVTENITSIDEVVDGAIDRPMKLLNPVELAILRQAVFEFVHCKDVPYKVVINEAVELAKEFGAQDGFKYINGVLNKLAKTLRALEFSK